MNKPKKLVLDDGAHFSLGCQSALGGTAIVLFTVGLAMTQSDATLRDMVLPLAALSALMLFWFALNAIIGLAHRFSDRRGINRVFKDQVWQAWQFRSGEWQRIVEAEYQQMRPEDGLGVYVGAVYAGIVGLVIGAIMIGVAKFVIKDEELVPVFTIAAVALLLLMIGVGLLQPVKERWEARKHRRRALRVTEPRVWFGTDGVYHETRGYTSLKNLVDVTDQTRSRKRIKFVVEATSTFGGASFSSQSVDRYPVWFRVPSGCEQQAAGLVRRYRQERLRS